MTRISLALLGLFLVACGGASVSSSELGEEGSPRFGGDSSLEAGSPSPGDDSSQDAGAPSPGDDSSQDEGTPPSDGNPPEGQSTSHAVFWVGHSLTGFKMPQMVGEIAESLGLTYSWNAQIGIGAPLIWNWDNSATTSQVDSRSVLPEGGYDVLVLTEALPLINHTTWSNTNTYAGRSARCADVSLRNLALPRQRHPRRMCTRRARRRRLASTTRPRPQPLAGHRRCSQSEPLGPSDEVGSRGPSDGRALR